MDHFSRRRRRMEIAAAIAAAFIVAMMLAGCASTHGVQQTVIDENGHVSSKKVQMIDPNARYREGYLKALADIEAALKTTGPYSLTMSPEPVYRGPAWLRVYLKPMRIGNVYYPEGWYLIEAQPGTNASNFYYRPGSPGVAKHTRRSKPSKQTRSPVISPFGGVPLD